jgi:hypothetical protein
VATDKPTAAQQRKLDAFIGPPAPRRRYFHVPQALQDDVTPTELAALKLEGTGFSGASALFRRVILDGDVTGLTAIQVAISMACARSSATVRCRLSAAKPPKRSHHWLA